MVLAYVDTSAAMKLLFAEAETAPARAYFADRSGRRLVASWLLHTGLHCAAGRPAGTESDVLSVVLESIDLIDVSRGDLIAAGTHAPLRANDAIHLAVALRVGAQELFTYDRELADAASRAGIRVVSPGA